MVEYGLDALATGDQGPVTAGADSRVPHSDDHEMLTEEPLRTAVRTGRSRSDTGTLTVNSAPKTMSELLPPD